MSLIKILISCLFTFSAYANMSDIEQLIKIKAVHFSPEPTAEDEKVAVQLSKRIQDVSYHRSIKAEAYLVSISTINGSSYHVADYFNGTRVVTCLNGYYMGLQAIGVNGIIIADSVAVEWHKNYFLHYYPEGQVISYPTKQFLKIYQ